MKKTLKQRATRAGVLLVWMAVAPAGGAQDSSKYYTVIHADEFTIDWKAFYDRADELTAELRREFPHHLDLAYGDHPKQRLDLYLPKEKVEGAPVVVFFHGGGFREGDRAHYGFVARPFLARDVITAVASYRLGPEFAYPAPPDDARSAIEWLHRNVVSYGGAPGEMYVAGHSAGSILAGTVCASTDWLDERGLPRDLIRGCVPISASQDLRDRDRPDYLPDPSLRETASPLLNIRRPVPRMVVAAGSLETALIEPSHEFAAKLKEAGGRADVVIEEGMEHHTIVLALADEGSELFRAVIRMIENP